MIYCWVWSLSVFGGQFLLHVAARDSSTVRSREFRGGRFSEVVVVCIRYEISLGNLLLSVVERLVASRRVRYWRFHCIREELVIGFNLVIFSNTYKLFWKNLTDAATAEYSPILHYYLTHMMYQNIIISQSHISLTDTDIENIDITEDERAAIVYISGYLVRALI